MPPGLYHWLRLFKLVDTTADGFIFHHLPPGRRSPSFCGRRLDKSLALTRQVACLSPLLCDEIFSRRIQFPLVNLPARNCAAKSLCLPHIKHISPLQKPVSYIYTCLLHTFTSLYVPFFLLRILSFSTAPFCGKPCGKNRCGYSSTPIFFLCFSFFHRLVLTACGSCEKSGENVDFPQFFFAPAVFS